MLLRGLRFAGADLHRPRSSPRGMNRLSRPARVMPASWRVSTEAARCLSGQPGDPCRRYPMSKWSEAFDAVREHDTVDTVDSVRPTDGSEPHSVNSVHSVSGGKGDPSSRLISSIHGIRPVARLADRAHHGVR